MLQLAAYAKNYSEMDPKFPIRVLILLKLIAFISNASILI